VVVEGLADIVAPEPVSFAPQTVGWYVLLVLLLACAAWLVARARRRYAANLYRRQALHELEALAADLEKAGGRHALAARLPALLKRVALHIAPRETVASLTDAEWLQALDHMYGGDGFSKGPGRILPTLAYGTEAVIKHLPRADLDALVRLSREWIGRHQAGSTRAAA